MAGTNWTGMEGKKTPFECSTGNCHAGIVPPVIFLDFLSSCKHAVITQNPLSSTQMSSAHQLPQLPLTKQVTVLQSCHKEATTGVVFSGPTWFSANASRKGPEKALLPVLQSPGSSVCVLQCWSIKASSGARTCPWAYGEATAGHHQSHTTLFHTAAHLQKHEFICW